LFLGGTISDDGGGNDNLESPGPSDGDISSPHSSYTKDKQDNLETQLPHYGSFYLRMGAVGKPLFSCC